MRVLPIILVSVVLTACAATPKPEMQAHQYQDVAKALLAVRTCVSQGFMAPDIGAFGSRYVYANAANFSYNQQQLNTAIEDNTGFTVSKEECNTVAMQIHSKKQYVDIQNAAYKQQQLEQQNNQPSRTYCNKIGTQLICNTY